MSQFAAVIQLSSLDGNNGFRLDGVSEGDRSGTSVASAGDVNGDGFDDLIIGAYAAPSGSYSGSSYVVFGKASGFSVTLLLSSLDGHDGFSLSGVAAGDSSGHSVSSVGDVNGDGFDDLIVGADRAHPNGFASGSSYLVFGKASGFGATMALSSLDGHNGFRLDGVAASDGSGYSVASAGDVNGDGFDDLIIGAYHADPNGSASGSSYVVFGKASGFGATLALSSLDGGNGFRLDGVSESDLSGVSVSSAGDLNGDGFVDVIVGAKYADPNGSQSGASYVVFGKAHGFSATIALSALDGSNGFRLDGVAATDRSGFSVSSAGDVNGDGFVDLIVGAGFADPNGSASGSSYVVFGKVAGFGATLALSSLDGSNGLRLDGVAAGDLSGRSVSSAGDMNGDGFDDLIVGAYFADPNGSFSGSSYVLFGHASGFSGTLALSSLDGSNGFRIDGVAAGDSSGRSVASAGDVNGDGFADIIVGAPFAEPNGSYSGASYVVFGHKPNEAVVRVGTDIANTIHGSDFGDRLDGLGGDDTLIGHDGRDTISGGHGNDVLIGGGAGDRLIGRAGTNTFVYDEVSDSAGAGRDLVRSMDGTVDKFDLWFTVTGMDASVDSNLHHLETDLDAAHLAAGHAVLVNGNGRTFLVVDANGTAGYQSGGDLLIQLKNVDHPEAIGVSSFI